VAYDATPGNPKRHEEPTPAMWYLMVAGRRCAVMPYTDGEPERDVERGLTRWVKANAIDPEAATAPAVPAVAQELWEE
jgi:hypothetical protein